MEPCSADDFRAAMSRWCSGVSIVTASHDGVVHGMTVSAFSSVGIAPPTILVCLRSGSRTAAMIERAGLFAVNVLAAGQSAIADRFAGRISGVPSALAATADRFHGIAVRPGACGVPLIEEALANLECAVSELAEVSGHRIVFAHVCAVHTRDADPLLYYRGEYQSIVYGRRNRDR